jgi:hypothetical protein
MVVAPLITPEAARLIEQHDEWLKKKGTNGSSWFNIITSTLDENWQPDDDGGYIYDPDPGPDND